MQPSSFAAELLERGAVGYAGFAASLMLERDPDLRERQGADAVAGWRAHLTQRLLELSAAMATGEKRLFTARVTWSRKAFTARGQPDEDLRKSLQALRDVLAERLPASAVRETLAYIDDSLDALASPPAVASIPELDPSRAMDRVALRYLQQVLEGNVTDAIDEIARTAAGAAGPRAVYLKVLLPAQREIGRLWHAGEVSVAEEHLVTAATQRAMAAVVALAKRAPANGRTVVVAAVAGNIHDIGPRALADFFQLGGWRTIYIGADVPLHDLPAMLAFYNADVLMMAASLSTHLPRVAKAIEAIAQRSERKVRVVVGGAAFDEAPELWKRLGADGYAATIDEAVTVADRLTTN